LRTHMGGSLRWGRDKVGRWPGVCGISASIPCAGQIAWSNMTTLFGLGKRVLFFVESAAVFS
jgi:hypothetical protein